MKITIYRLCLFFFLFLALLLPSLLCGLLLYNNSQNDLKVYTSRNIQYTLSTNAANVEVKLGTMDAASTSMLISLAQNSNIMIPNENLDPIDLYQSTLYSFTTHTSLINNTYTIDGFNHFYLYFPYRSLLLISNMSAFENVSSNTLDCHVIPEGQWGIASPFEDVISNPRIGQLYREWNFAKNFTLKDKEDNELILTSCIEESYVNQQLITNFRIPPDYAVILDKQGIPLSSKVQCEIGTSIPAYQDMMDAILSTEARSYQEIQLGDKTYLLNWVYSPDNDWYYVLATDLAAVLSGSTTLPDVIIPICCCALVFAVFLTLFLRLNIRRPIKRLCHAMESFPEQQGNSNAPPITEKPFFKGELSPLFDRFNQMAARLSDLANNTVEQRNTQNLNKIQLLQTEINPHMLYNALESLYSIARINEQEEISTLVMALSRFFRIALSGGKHFVPFRDAFELANQYITVQNIRINYKISFTHSIPENISDLSVPKFLIQPVVENCIHHGFQNKRDKWLISLSAGFEEGYAIIRISDNGIGISESDLNELNQRINDFNFETNIENKGYALRNLNYQIKLQYGGSSGIFLNSIYGEGTEVVIRLALESQTSLNSIPQEVDHI